MSKIVSLTNQKGGVGKTTTSVNLAVSFAVSEVKTLLIDLDPQSNATKGCGIGDDHIRFSLNDVLMSNKNVNEATSNNTNKNINESNSNSNVTTSNKNVNENKSTSDNTNRNINESKSEQTINQNIAFRKGSTIQTISTMKNILCEYQMCNNEIPKDFCIYDLGSFTCKSGEIVFVHSHTLPPRS